MEHTELEWAYLAGIVDGEGSCTIALAGKRRPFPNVAMLTVTNTDARLVQWLVSKFQGKPYPRAIPARAKPAWNVCWAGKNAKEILLHIQPYLLIKGQQAGTLLAFIALLGRRSPGGGVRVTTDDNISKRRVLAEAMAILNNRGERTWR